MEENNRRFLRICLIFLFFFKIERDHKQVGVNNGCEQMWTLKFNRNNDQFDSSFVTLSLSLSLSLSPSLLVLYLGVWASRKAKQ